LGGLDPEISRRLRMLDGDRPAERSRRPVPRAMESLIPDPVVTESSAPV
jgi:hypothetical protein